MNRVCEFCDAIASERYDKKINWSVRSTFADDNIEEILESRTYTERWIENYSDFKLFGYNYEGTTFVGVEYLKELTSNEKEKMVISPFSEMIQFNFCPICGNQISDNVKGFSDYRNDIISIEEIGSIK